MNQRNQLENNNPSIHSGITENTAETASLADLPLAGEQAGGIKAGDGSISRVGDRFTTTVQEPDRYR
jgi:hypothetical protein